MTNPKFVLKIISVPFVIASGGTVTNPNPFFIAQVTHNGAAITYSTGDFYNDSFQASIGGFKFDILPYYNTGKLFHSQVVIKPTAPFTGTGIVAIFELINEN